MWLPHKKRHMEGIILVIRNLIALSLSSFLPLLKINKGFDEFEVQVDNCGKLTIRGRRPLGDGKYMRLEQVFDVPKDSRIDKIEGKFDEGRLSLLMPKKVVTEKGTQRAVSCEKKPKQEPPPAVCGEKEEVQTQKDQPKSSDIKKDESIHKEKPKREEAAVHEEKPSTDQKKGEHPAQPEQQVVSADNFEEYKRKAMAWKVTVKEEAEGWLDYGLMDGLMETISKNKKAIAVAAAAFTAGFYISRKL